MLSTIGITDCIEIKFAENRQNGQSRGFATLVVGSEASVNTFLERGANCRLHNNAPQALPFNKQSLAKLEEANKGSASGVSMHNVLISQLDMSVIALSTVCTSKSLNFIHSQIKCLPLLLIQRFVNSGSHNKCQTKQF